MLTLHPDRNQLTYLSPGPGIVALLIAMIFRWLFGSDSMNANGLSSSAAYHELGGSLRRYSLADAVPRGGKTKRRSQQQRHHGEEMVALVNGRAYDGRSAVYEQHDDDVMVPEEQAHAAEMERIRDEVSAFLFSLVMQLLL